MQLNTHITNFYHKVRKSSRSLWSVHFIHLAERSWQRALWRTGGAYLLMGFMMFGWGCWTWKEVERLSARKHTHALAVPPIGQNGLLEAVRSAAGSAGTLDEEEALRWVNHLQSLDDASLDLEQRLKKYRHLGMASAVVSASSESILRQRLWSSLAIVQNEEVLTILAESKKLRRPDELNEAHTRLLLAMALHYFQDGGTGQAEIRMQFGNIDRDFLEEHGFCQNIIMRALAEKNIIELPHHQEKYI